MPQQSTGLALLRLAAVFVAITFSAAQTLAQGSICAEGGGSLANDDWAKPAFAWMMRQAEPLAKQDGEGGGVRVVMLGSMDEGVPAPSEEELAQLEDEGAARFTANGAISVRQLYINSGTARDEATLKTVREAHIIWIRGGSQSQYCKTWKGTPLEAAIRSVFARGGVVGGTSAGCAVLGEVIYDAAGGSLDPNEALRNPFAKQISFTQGFLELTPGVIFDSHLTERARIARLPILLARIRSDLGRDVLGVGIDVRTALCIGPDGAAEVFGTGAACFMWLTPQSRVTVERAKGDWPTPPLVTDVAVRQILTGEKVNIRSMVSQLLTPEQITQTKADWTIPATEFKKDIDRTDARFIRGDATKHAERGQYFMSPALPSAALFHGTFMLSDGTNEVPGAVVATRVFSLKDRTQTAAGGVLWALATTDARWGSFMDMGAALRMLDDGRLQSYFPNGKLGAAMSAPVFIKSATFKPGLTMPAPRERQACSFVGLTMHILPVGWSFDPQSGTLTAPGSQPK